MVPTTDEIYCTHQFDKRCSHLSVSRVSASPVCLSLSVVSVTHLDRQDRRSSTFTLPPCVTSRGVLMNEVAISYCSLKRVLKCMCVCAKEVEGKAGKRQDQVATGGKMN